MYNGETPDYKKASEMFREIAVQYREEAIKKGRLIGLLSVVIFVQILLIITLVTKS